MTLVHTTCRSCKAAGFWAVWSHTGRAVLINKEADPKGNIRIESVPFGRPLAVLTTTEPVKGEIRHTTHFATCPDADQWRRGKGHGRQDAGSAD